nr:unnamed protein product [Digitaria exilis]
MARACLRRRRPSASSSAGSCHLYRPLLPPPVASYWNGVVTAPYLVGAVLERRCGSILPGEVKRRRRLGDALNSIFLQQLLGVHVYTHVLILGPPLPAVRQWRRMIRLFQPSGCTST